MKQVILKDIDIERLDLLAEKFVHAIKSKAFICLYGPIGAGKTSFIKFMGKYHGIKEMITSPTFVTMHEYHSGRFPFYHFDFYRFEGEVMDIVLNELEELSQRDSVVTAVEWANFIDLDCIKERVDINFKYNKENYRDLEFSAVGKDHTELLERFSQSIENS